MTFTKLVFPINPSSRFSPNEDLLNSIEKTKQEFKKFRIFVFKEIFMMFCTCVCVPYIVFSYVKFFVDNPVLQMLFLPYLYMVGWFHLGRIFHKNIDYENFFKENFVIEAIKNIDKNFVYEKESFFDYDELENTGILNYCFSDFISGNYKGLNFRFAEYSLQNSYGAVLSCEFYKDFKYNLTIKNKEIYSSTMKSDKLDNTQFNDFFDIITTDKIETRFLLSFSFMERLCKINANENFGFVSAAFKNGKFYLFLENSKNLFEPSFFFAPSIAQAHYFRDEFLEILSVIDELNLTLNIYPKTVLKNQKFTR